ncbi:hypothetical protein ACE6H2_006832 [Prunus campanulata]
MEAMEIKSVDRPIIIFVGKDFRKSSSAYRDVRIPKNINTEVVEEKNRKTFPSSHPGFPPHFPYGTSTTLESPTNPIPPLVSSTTYQPTTTFTSYHSST